MRTTKSVKRFVGKVNDPFKKIIKIKGKRSLLYHVQGNPVLLALE